VNNVERQQIKWFAYAATILITGDLLSSLVAEVWGARWVSGAGFVLYIAGLAGLPVAVGIAILRYHLYDIDFIISRTLVYVSLGAVLASLFEFNVVVLSGLFSEFAEHYHLTESHWLAEVISALGIAVVFDPLRDRIQRFVDRRLFGEAGGKTPAQSKETNSA
jgi:hypothetical protein